MFFNLHCGNGAAMEFYKYMSNINFTKTTLEGLNAPHKGFKVYKDTKENGLCLYITSGNAKTFFVRKRVNGKDERIILGKFPDLSIENARKKAAQTKGEIAQGIDPQEKKKAIRDDSTFAEMFYEYIEKHAKLYKKTWKFDEVEIRRLLPHFFKKKLLTITMQTIRDEHQKIGKENGLYIANKILQILSSMFNRAIEWGWNGKNPCKGIKKFKEKSRERFLSAEELSRFFEAMQTLESKITADYIMLSLLTGARKSNVLEMQWEDIDFDEKIWYIKETKNGTSQRLPLSENAIEILIERFANKGKSPFVFASAESKTGHLVEPKRAWATLLKRANIQDLRLHDLRRTLGSWQAATGANSYIIGKSLNHKSQSATAIYARLDIDPVRASINKATDAMFANIKK